MAGNLDGFDASQVDPKTDFEPLPKGDYPVVAINSGFEENSKKTGEFLKFELEVIDGPFRGRRLFDRLNLKNQNEKAVKIAQATLSSICRAVGVLRPRDSSELHNKPMIAKVDVEPREDKPGAFSNKVSNYEAIGAGATYSYTVPAAQVAAPAAPQAPVQQSLPPWKRKSA
jgi:hypothetical protein